MPNTPIDTNSNTNESKPETNPLLLNELNEEIIAIASSSTPEGILNNDSSIGTKIVIITSNGILCTGVASPTAFLNFLASLEIPSSQIKNFDNLIDVIKQKTEAQLLQAALSTTQSLGSNVPINIIYLGPAAFKLKDILVKLFKKAAYKCGIKEENTEVEVIELVALVWAFCSAVPFAQIAKETFSFMGNWSYIPFSLNLFSYYATRYAGTEGFLNGLFNADLKFKNQVLADLYRVKEKEPLIITVEPNSTLVGVQNALIEFLTKFYTEKATHFKGTHFTTSTRAEVKERIVKIIEYLTAVVGCSSVASTFANEGLEGFASLVGQTVSNHTAALPLTGSYIATLPTPFFYGRAIANLPEELDRVITTIYRKFAETFGEGQTGKERCQNLVKAVGWTLLATAFGYFSYGSALGIQSVVETALNSGYLSYLAPLGISPGTMGGEILIETAGLTIFAVNLSSTEKLVNKWMCEKAIKDIQQIDLQTAIMLLTYHPDKINLSKLTEHHYFTTNNQTGCLSTFFHSGIPNRGIFQRKGNSYDPETEALLDPKSPSINIQETKSNLSQSSNRNNVFPEQAPPPLTCTLF